jgi:hypothetical protein
VAFFPVNLLSLRAAAEQYRTVAEAEVYVEAVKRFDQLVSEYGADLMPGGRVDEEAVAEWVDLIRADPETFAGSGVLELAEQLYPMIGQAAELQAIMPLVSHGVLSGVGLQDFRPAGSIGAIVRQLDENARRASGGVSVPMITRDASVSPLIRATPENAWRQVLPAQEFGTTPDGRIKGLFLATGKPDDDLALTPVESTTMKDRVPEAILRESLGAGLWDFEQGKWKAGAKVRFALPTPYFDRKGTDLTRSGAFANYVCAPTRILSGEGVTLTVTFLGGSAGTARFSGVLLIDGLDGFKISGQYRDGRYTFRGEGQAKGYFTVSEGAGSLVVEGPQPLEVPIAVAEGERSCPSSELARGLQNQVRVMSSACWAARRTSVRAASSSKHRPATRACRNRRGSWSPCRGL